MSATSNITVIQGTAKGVDSAGAAWGNLRGYKVEPHPADWKKHGKAAGFIRNEEMMSSGIDGAAIFWDGKSNGTRHTLGLIQASNMPYITVVFPIPEPTEEEERYQTHREQTAEQVAMDHRRTQLSMIELAIEERKDG